MPYKYVKHTLVIAHSPAKIEPWHASSPQKLWTIFKALAESTDYPGPDLWL